MPEHFGRTHIATMFALAAIATSILPSRATAQHDMSGEHHMAMSAAGSMPGQAAFGAIAEVVRILEADSTTDWSRVNIEALRQHLIDMDDVVMRSSVEQRAIPGGVMLTVTGPGRTAGAIKRIAVNHVRMLDESAAYTAHADPLPNGARITVTAKNPSDQRMVARIRGLGFAGLLTEGEHHAAHHLAIARGDANPHGL